MLRTTDETEKVSRTENKPETESASNLVCTKDALSELDCSVPKIGISNVQLNGSRGCKCDELIPYYKQQNTPVNVRPVVHGTRSPTLIFDGRNQVLIKSSPKTLDCEKYLGKSRTEPLPFPSNMKCLEKVKIPEDRAFIPRQGMNSEELPQPVFCQYYPNQNEVHNFNLLPLPFLNELSSKEINGLSLSRENMQEKWKKFLYTLPHNEFQSIQYQDEIFWRWKNYLRYKPDGNRTDFRLKMQTGPKYDCLGRLPITGTELLTFREQKSKTKPKCIMRRQDGTRTKGVP